MDWNLVVAVVSMIAGIVAAWFGYVAVSERLRRRRTAPAPATGLPTNGAYDAFISYAGDDEGRAESLARDLQSRGIRVFLAKWIDVGLVEYAEKEKALHSAGTGVLLFSRSTMTRAAIRDDYAAILQRVHDGGRRFIPVLIDDTELPPYARIRKPLDLTDPRTTAAQVDRLARAIRAA